MIKFALLEYAISFYIIVEKIDTTKLKRQKILKS